MQLDPEATLPGMCDFDSCTGCMDPDAFNYDASATIPAFVVQDDGTSVDACLYAGCTIFYACNYDPLAM